MAQMSMQMQGARGTVARRSRYVERDVTKATPQMATGEAKRFLGGYAEGVTPVPIPNTEVKPLWADGTARVAVWESRSPPGILSQKPHHFYE